MDFLTVFRKETLNESRRLRQYMMRVAYVGIVFALIVLFNRNELFNLGAGTSSSATELSQKLLRLASNLYTFTAFAQILAALLITPVLITASFQSERRYGTLELLSITRLKDRDVVLGKVSARFLLMGLLLLAGLPVLASIKIFGLVNLQLVLCNFFCSISAMLIAGGTAAYFGLSARNLLQAIGYTYAVVAGFLIVTFVGGEIVLRIIFHDSTFGGAGGWLRTGIIYAVNPIYAQIQMYGQMGMATSEQNLMANFWLLSVFQLAMAVLVCWYWLMRAEQQYRWWRLGISSGSQAVEHQRERLNDARARGVPERQTGAGGGDAFELQERSIARRGKIKLFERGVLISFLVVEGVMVLAALGGDANVHRIGMIVQFILLGASASVIGGASIAQEQEDHTMVVLLTTPMEPHQILWGKMRSLLRVLWIPVAVMLAHLVVFAVMMQIHWASLVMVALAVPVFLALILVISLIISSRIPRAGRAVTYALSVLLIVTLGTFMGGVLISSAGLSPDDPLTVVGESLRTLNPLVIIYEGIQPGPGLGRFGRQMPPPNWIGASYLLRSIMIGAVLVLLLWRILMMRFNAWVRQNI